MKDKKVIKTKRGQIGQLLFLRQRVNDRTRRKINFYKIGSKRTKAVKEG